MLQRIRSTIASFRSPHFAETLARIESRMSCQDELVEQQTAALEKELESRRQAIEATENNIRNELKKQSLHEPFTELAAVVKHWQLKVDLLQAAICRLEERVRLRSEANRRDRLSDADYDAISRRGVFVIGAARSGTTILHTCFNSSPDVCMLGEAFFWQFAIQQRMTPGTTSDFVETFNNRQLSYGNPRYKGLYLPQGHLPEHGVLDTLHRLGRQYRYVGDKIALGAAIKKIGDDWEPELLEFQATYFFHAHYFFVIRRPAESIWSMTKMFSRYPVEKLVACWLRSFRVSIEMYLLFPNTYVVFLEDLNEATVSRFAEILKCEMRVPQGMLKPASQKSSMKEDEMPAALFPYESDIREFQRIYAKTRERFCRKSLKGHGGVMDREFFQSVRKLLTEAIDRYESDGGEQSLSAA